MTPDPRYIALMDALRENRELRERNAVLESAVADLAEYMICANPKKWDLEFVKRALDKARFHATKHAAPERWTGPT